MKNLPAGLMWLDSAKKQVELAKDAYREAKIHILKSLATTFAEATFGNTCKIMILEVNETTNTVLYLDINKPKPERYNEFDIDEIDIYPVTDENGNITIRIMER